MKTMNLMRKYAAVAYARGIRVRAELDIGRACDEAQALYERLKAARDELAEKQLEGDTPEEELEKLRDQIKASAQRYKDLMGAVEMAKGEQGARVAAQFNRTLGLRESSMQAMRGSLYRSLMTATPIEAKVQAAMSLPTVTDASSGSRSILLPQTRSTELLTEIFADEAFLSEISMTSLPGLTLPRISMADAEGDDDVDEGNDAPDAKLTEGLITFGRFRYSKNVTVPTSMLDGTDTALDSYISARHTNLMRTRIQRRIFDVEASSKYAHMSVYDQTEVKVKEISGTALLDTIISALADLPAEVRSVAKVVLTPAMWLGIVRELTNGAATLFGKPDEGILGFTPVLSDYVTDVIVGDLKTICVNFDAPVRFATEDHAKKGTTDMVLSTFFDIQIQQPERLRIIKGSSTMRTGLGGSSTYSGLAQRVDVQQDAAYVTVREADLAALIDEAVAARLPVTELALADRMASGTPAAEAGTQADAEGVKKGKKS